MRCNIETHFQPTTTGPNLVSPPSDWTQLGAMGDYLGQSKMAAGSIVLAMFSGFGQTISNKRPETSLKPLKLPESLNPFDLTPESVFMLLVCFSTVRSGQANKSGLPAVERCKPGSAVEECVLRYVRLNRRYVRQSTRAPTWPQLPEGSACGRGGIGIRAGVWPPEVVGSSPIGRIRIVDRSFVAAHLRTATACRPQLELAAPRAPHRLAPGDSTRNPTATSSDVDTGGSHCDRCPSGHA
jgi:hypothetical protein